MGLQQKQHMVLPIDAGNQLLDIVDTIARVNANATGESEDHVRWTILDHLSGLFLLEGIRH